MGGRKPAMGSVVGSPLAGSSEIKVRSLEEALKVWEDLLLKFDPQNVEAQENVTRLKKLLGRN